MSASSASTPPALSVVVPTRGRPELVRLAVQSVLAQDYAGDITVVVVHDQEQPQHCLTELSRPGRTVRVMRNEGDLGLAGSRNAGLRTVTTELVASCDDDDTWLPGKVRKQVALLEANPDMLVVGGGIRLMMPKDQVVEWLGPSDVVTVEHLMRSRRKELHSSTLLMRRTVFDLAGDYDVLLPNSYAEDYEWLLRAAQHGRIGVVRQIVAVIKKDGQSWFPRERSEVVSTALQRVLDQHPELAGSRRGHARILGQIAFAEASLHRNRSAVRWAGQSLRRWPFAPQAVLALIQVVFRVDPKTLLATARLAGRGLS
jgi:glycosyltransferase involved in cell wall biosynthesis